MNPLDYFDKAVAFLNGISQWSPAVITCALCFLFGLLLKRTPVVPNWIIPWAIVLVIGPGVMLLWSDWETSTVKTVSMFIRSRILIGVVVGGLATLFHRFAWKVGMAWLKKKFPDAEAALEDDSDPKAFLRTTSVTVEETKVVTPAKPEATKP